MKTYICYYNCPFCPKPCCINPESEGNLMIDAENKTLARQYFTQGKSCRYMKITHIEEYTRIFKILHFITDNSN